MVELEYKKIYIDSRFRTSDSISSSNFKIELPVTINMPTNAVYYITDIALPNSLKTVQSNYNDMLYIAIRKPDAQGIRVWKYYKIQLIENNYTTQSLADQIKTQFNLTFPNALNCEADTVNNRIIITSRNINIAFHILTDNELRQKQFYSTSIEAYTLINLEQMPYDVNNLNSCNKIITNTSTEDNKADNTLPLPYVSDFVELFIAASIYLCSPNFGSFDSLTCTGMNLSNIIRKININNGFGYMIQDDKVLPEDFNECSDRMSFKTIQFELKTSDGRYVPLGNTNISFTILFALK